MPPPSQFLDPKRLLQNDKDLTKALKRVENQALAPTKGPVSKPIPANSKNSLVLDPIIEKAPKHTAKFEGGAPEDSISLSLDK